MSIEEIKAIVKEHIDQALQGQSKESLKFEFKYKWPNLNDKKELNEFLKDITAMANTYGPDGFIVYGFDDDGKKFNDVKFTDCGLKDDSQLYDLQSKYLSNNFELNEYDEIINGHQLSILHFPPTLNKPILINNYCTFPKKNIEKLEKEKIFVRKGTTIRLAKKEDLELMYFDRKNIVPDYDIEAALIHLYPDAPDSEPYVTKMEYELSIENLGRRSIFIDYVHFEWFIESFRYEFDARIWESSFNSKSNISRIIRPNDIKFFSGNAEMYDPPKVDNSLLGRMIAENNSKIFIMLSNGKTISQKMKLSEALFRSYQKFTRD